MIQSDDDAGSTEARRGNALRTLSRLLGLMALVLFTACPGNVAQDAAMGVDTFVDGAAPDMAIDATTQCQPAVSPLVDAHVLMQTDGATAWRVSYVADGHTLLGQICVPTSAGPHPILLYAHEGFTGLGVEWGLASGTVCRTYTDLGFVVVMSQYRGQSDSVGASEGAIEFCNGEATDSLALLAIARQRCDVAPDRTVAYGIAHGGCNVLHMIPRANPPLRGAVVARAPTDMAALYRYHQANLMTGDATERAAHQFLFMEIGSVAGTPDANPSAFRDRSPVTDATAIAAIATPILIVEGTLDYFVPLAQECAMRDALVSAGASFTSYSLDPQGMPMTAPLAGCAAATFASGPWPTPPAGFSGGDTFVALGGADHYPSGILAARALDATQQFLVTHAR